MVKDTGKAVRNVRYRHVLKYVVSFFGCPILCKLISDLQSGYINSGSISLPFALSILCQHFKKEGFQVTS